MDIILTREEAIYIAAGTSNNRTSMSDGLGMTHEELLADCHAGLAILNAFSTGSLVITITAWEDIDS